MTIDDEVFEKLSLEEIQAEVALLAAEVLPKGKTVLGQVWDIAAGRWSHGNKMHSAFWRRSLWLYRPRE
jgi:hypothetical protein